MSLPEKEAGSKGVWPLVSLSPDGRVLAVSVQTSLFLYLTNNGELAESMRDVHRGHYKFVVMGPLLPFFWRQVVAVIVILGCGITPPGLQAQVDDLEQRIAKATTNESFKVRYCA